MNSTSKPTILGIDPGTKEMGFAVVRGQDLLAYGVRTLRNGKRPYEVVGQARTVLLDLVARHVPQLVAIEEPLLLPTKRAAVMSVIGQELRARAEELGIDVVEISARAVRERAIGNAFADKVEVAEKLIESGFGQLSALVPTRPIRSALGMRPRAKYWLHMFDALALAVAAQAICLERAA